MLTSIACLTAWLPTCPLLAAPPEFPLQLRYSAPESCPSQRTFLAALKRLSGNIESNTRRVNAELSVRQDAPDNFTLTLVTELDGISGERVLHGHACATVADAAVVTLAILLNPDAQLAADAGIEVVDQPVKPVSAPVVPSVPRTMPKRPTPRAPAERPTRIEWLTSSAVNLHIGTLPQPGPALSLGLGAKYGRSSWLFSGAYALPETAHVETQPTAGGRLWFGLLQAVDCWSFFSAPPGVGACLGAAWTRVAGRGLGVNHRRTGSTNWWAPSAEFFADFPLNRRAAFRLAASAAAPLARPNTYLDDVGTVQRPAALTALLQAGVILRVP